MNTKSLAPTLASFVPAPGDINPWPAIEAAYPEWVKSMHATEQDRFYHSEGDVWTHTKMVVDALIAHPWWHELDDEYAADLFLRPFICGNIGSERCFRSHCPQPT